MMLQLGTIQLGAFHRYFCHKFVKTGDHHDTCAKTEMSALLLLSQEAAQGLISEAT